MAKRKNVQDDDALEANDETTGSDEPRAPRFGGLRGVLIPALVITVLMALSASVLVSAFHSLRPHEIPLSVTGGQASVDRVSALLGSGDDPAFEVQAVPEGAKPSDAVSSREVYASLILADKAWQVVYAGANGQTVNSFIGSALRPGSGIAYSTSDVVPTASGDSSSWAVFLLVLAGAIAGVAFGVLLALRAGGLTRSSTFAALAIFALVAGTVTTLIVRYPFDALRGSPLVPIVLQVLLLFVVAGLTMAMTRVGRAYGAAIAVLLFVSVGTAFSGALLPPPYLPKNASFLVDVLPNGLAAQATTGASYFDGASGTTGIGGLITWAVVAVIALVIVDRRRPAVVETVPED